MLHHLLRLADQQWIFGSLLLHRRLHAAGHHLLRNRAESMEGGEYQD